jgi:purine-nucleoside phosphorylase
MYEKIKETAQFLRQQLQSLSALQADQLPTTAIVLGTGLGQLASEIDIVWQMSYADIPNFPVSTVEGHDGRLIVGRLGNSMVLAMKGRFHYYEGYSMQQVTFPVRVMYELGIRTLFVSNAAGGVNENFRVGDMMVITDHINFFPEHPLRGKNLPTGPRFPDMHEPYDHKLIALADKIAADKDIRLVHGTYIGVQGPSYETPAEYRAYHTLGADAVGMSTVPEVIVARHCGIRVFGISIITNIYISDSPVEATHEEVQEAANSAQPLMTEIFKEMIKNGDC